MKQKWMHTKKGWYTNLFELVVNLKIKLRDIRTFCEDYINMQDFVKHIKQDLVLSLKNFIWIWINMYKKGFFC